MKNISSRINKIDSDKLESVYGSKYVGAKRSIEGYLALRDYSIAEIKQLNFNRFQLIGLIFSLRGSMMVSARMHCNVEAFYAHIKDFERINNGISGYGGNYKDLMKKLQKLTASQVYFLQDEIIRLWNQGKEIDDIIKSLQP